jgi:hypothetical protein
LEAIMTTSYADSAQGRELDRGMAAKRDQWGNPLPDFIDVFHDYDQNVRRRRDEETEYRKGLSARIQAAMAQMEMICPQ